jgi:hypothetical protein
MSRAGLAPELVQRMRDESAVRPGSLPIRVALAMASGTVLAGAVGYSHMAVDDRAVMIIGREFAELVRMPERLVGALRHQPVDQAELEHGAAMRARIDGALAYWQRQLPQMPHCLYAGPRVGSTASSVMVQMSSPAVTAALRHIAARTRMSRSSAVLAAICTLLTRRTGYQRLVFPALSGNRFERHLSDYVGTLSQSTLTVVDTDTPSFDQLIGRAWSAIVSSSRHGMYDAHRRDDVVARVQRDRGVRFNFKPRGREQQLVAVAPGGIIGEKEKAEVHCGHSLFGMLIRPA